MFNSLLHRECEGRPFGAKRCIDLMMICSQIVLKSGLSLHATRRRGAAVHIIDLPIVGCLLEELIDSWSLCLTMLIPHTCLNLTKGYLG
jgi:hypothetical protein